LNNYYQILGVPNNASCQSIKKAFRCKAKELHPDVNQTTSNQHFLKINEAYQVLSNCEKRRIYDLRLKRGVLNQRVYYRPGNVQNRPYEYYTARRQKQEEEPPGVFERILDHFLFLSLFLAGLFAIGFGVFRLWQEPIEGVNPFNGIILGVVLTSLLVAGWVKWNKVSG
jgi:curved DNA-binding protein CbpA